ncbi:MAG: hypothetical protein HeimC3_50990 [Candidatus Heimdallarchaeota archaeon LC_3]|nr:MAG: hypothetical protein HeimC3_50990 [Candidatus Heimdallarchaeota archaeon LC_3]
MDEDKLEHENTYLLRSKLHTWCGISRINQKKYSAGTAAIYGALVARIQWFAFFPQRVKQYNIILDEDLHNDHIFFSVINNIKELNEIGFDFKSFPSIMELGLDKDLCDDDFNVNDTINQITQLMIKIGVMLFNFDELPTKNPDLF